MRTCPDMSQRLSEGCNPGKPMSRFEIFAVAAPGLEDIVCQEVANLCGREVTGVPGGAIISGELIDAAGQHCITGTAAARPEARSSAIMPGICGSQRGTCEVHLRSQGPASIARDPDVPLRAVARTRVSVRSTTGCTASAWRPWTAPSSSA